MSIDIYLIPFAERTITKEYLEERLPDTVQIVACNENADGLVDFFSLKQPSDPDSEQVYEFHLQDDGYWWHPVYVRGADVMAVDQSITESVMDALHLEYDIERMG